MVNQNWKGKISNHAQLGGIETSVIDNGASRGTRIAWVNTGTGLRFKVVIDRAMDIGDAFYNQHNLVWLSNLGVTSPQPFSDRGVNWLKTFGGGLVTTCGLTHVGGPESDEHGERGLHDEISNLPAEIVSVIQPDPLMGKMEMSITGKIRQSQPLGTQLELTRTISGVLGEPVIRIHDEILNRGNMPAPHMILYHCNFGWPLVDEGADIVWKGDWEPRDEASKEIFNDHHKFRKCSAPLQSHSGTGEAAAFINATADASGIFTCGLYNPQIGIALALRFQKKQLPWLTNWQHWGKGEYVTGLEPGTNPPIGQSKSREENTLIFLAPGECKHYDLEFEILHEPEKIDHFLKT
jgi:hypothetical protein